MFNMCKYVLCIVIKLQLVYNCAKKLITIFKTYNFKIITFYLEHLILLIDYNI